MEGRNRRRPDGPLRVVVLLNSGRGGPSDTDPVAAHHDEPLLSLLVEVGGLHLLAVLGPEHEDVTDLDTAHDAQRFRAAGARVAGHRVPDVGVTVRREVAAGRYVHPVRV